MAAKVASEEPFIVLNIAASRNTPTKICVVLPDALNACWIRSLGSTKPRAWPGADAQPIVNSNELVLRIALDSRS